MEYRSINFKVQEFIYLIDDLKADDVNLLSIEELKNYLQEQMRIAYDLKESQIESCAQV